MRQPSKPCGRGVCHGWHEEELFAMSVDGIDGEQSTSRKERKALMEFKPLALAAASMHGL